MTKIYLWQNERFPQFEWDTDVLLTPLGEVHTLQGQLLGRMAALGFEGLTAQVEALTNEILGSSQIEGVVLNADSVRSSVARHLGLETAGLERADHYTEGVVNALMQATQAFAEPLTDERMFAWHAAFFPLGYSDGYKITLDYTEEAKIPENAYLSVREITAETDKEAYEACLEQAGQQVAADEKTSVDQKASRFFDIEILVTEKDSEGAEKTVKIEPAAPVSVNIRIDEKPASQGSRSDQSDPTVLHFAEEGVEQIDSTVTDSQSKSAEEQNTEIQFEAESFSVYGVVYTVDFHWEVNGETYDFSMPGGGFVSFYDLIEVLGIEANDTSTEKDEIQELVEWA